VSVNAVKIHHGYSDGSGEYYVVIDAAACNGCGLCIAGCPQKVLELQTVMMDLEDKSVAAVKEEHRKKIKYTCSACKPEGQKTPCSRACKNKAVSVVWNKH
jgi:Fe-S-cluster-containing hydrogenase component 2